MLINLEDQHDNLVEFLVRECPGESSGSGNVADTAIQIIRGLQADKARLDFVEAQSNGDRWMSRMRTLGGFALQTTSDLHLWTEYYNKKGPFGTGKSAREAIDAAMKQCHESSKLPTKATASKPR